MLGLALVVLMGPGSEPAQPGADASKRDREAWESVGWGSEPAPAPKPAPAPVPGPAPESELAPEPGTEPGSEPESAWEAAGWGSEPADPDPDPSIEGPVAPKPDASEDWTNWDDASTDSSSAEAVSDFDDKVKVGDVLGGSLRLTGSFLRFDDDPVLFPDGDDALVLTVARVLLEADAGDHVHFSFNGFGELGRTPTGSGLNGTFASAGSTASAYRTRYLSWKFWEPASFNLDGTVTGSGSVSGQLGVDRASVRLSFKSINIDVGRFPISYTVAGMFTTNDFFAPFSATAVNSIYKPGVDAVRVSAGIGPTSSVDVMGVLGYNAPSCDPDADVDLAPTSFCFDEPDRPSWGRSAVFTRAAIVGGGFEWAVLGGKVSERWVAGGSFQGDAGRINLRGEFHVGIPDKDGQGHGSDDKPIYGRFSVGPTMQFAWQNAVITAEYMFASDGAKESSGLVTRALEPFSDDLPYLGRHYVGAAVGMEIIPILRVTATGIVSATDGSGLAGVSLAYNVADESDLILGVFVPWGKGYQGVDPTTMLPELGSEFGLSPLTAYLEARVFF